jgi:hypothetical protein
VQRHQRLAEAVVIAPEGSAPPLTPLILDRIAAL